MYDTLGFWRYGRIVKIILKYSFEYQLQSGLAVVALVLKFKTCYCKNTTKFSALSNIKRLFRAAWYRLFLFCPRNMGITVAYCFGTLNILFTVFASQIQGITGGLLCWSEAVGPSLNLVAPLRPAKLKKKKVWAFLCMLLQIQMNEMEKWIS